MKIKFEREWNTENDPQDHIVEVPVSVIEKSNNRCFWAGVICTTLILGIFFFL